MIRFYSMGPNNFVSSGFTVDVPVSKGPKSSGESGSVEGDSDSKGPNNFGDSSGVDARLGEESDTPFF